MTPVRTFPIRLAPLPGEALDSWLEALAYRLNVRLGDVLGDLGLAAPFQHGVRDVAVPTDWTIALREEEAARIAHATGTDPQQLRNMTLMRFSGRALRIDEAKRQVSKHVLWGRPRGSRFCPECLADKRRPLAADLAPRLVLRLPHSQQAACRLLPGLQTGPTGATFLPACPACPRTVRGPSLMDR